ncbi:MAG TPA: ABC transporter substrate-binding protein [Vicinamibacterales bacterium]|nr:ABC transporter substrate-binding protein [Vicinamibacterales bacterium]
MGVLFLAMVAWWRGCPPEGGAPLRSGVTESANEVHERGGQIVASLRAEPRSFNRLVSSDQTTDTLATLMQGRLVRVNRSTFELEPWLAERWESSSDGRTHTLHIRPGVVWSDGTPFTSADVLFSLKAVYDPTVKSPVASSLMVGGQPIAATAPDDATVVLTYAVPAGPGLRLLDMLPILPRHKLESALSSGTLAQTWGTATPPADIVGTGPFLLREYHPGQRLVFERNPRYWRKAANGDSLPYIDRLVLELVPDQNAELLRLQSGATDLTHSELRSDDYIPVRRAEEAGTLTMIELGVGPDADAFWFCLKPEKKARDPRFAFVNRREFRQAISHAVDREEFAQTVFLGEAVPIWGPITPGNRLWFSPNVPRYPFDRARARELLGSIGLEDRNGNGVVEDKAGTEARFTVITQQGLGYYERGTTVLREYAAAVGVALDIVPLEFSAMVARLLACDYDAIYMRPLATDLDPAGNLDYWLSSGSAHLWNMQQTTPATEWEKQIDTLMREQATTLDRARRQQIFAEVQKVLAENVPVLYFASPRLYYAHSSRVRGIVPSITRPPVLWNADSFSVTSAR